MAFQSQKSAKLIPNSQLHAPACTHVHQTTLIWPFLLLTKSLSPCISSFSSIVLNKLRIETLRPNLSSRDLDQPYCLSILNGYLIPYLWSYWQHFDPLTFLRPLSSDPSPSLLTASPLLSVQHSSLILPSPHGFHNKTINLIDIRFFPHQFRCCSCPEDIYQSWILVFSPTSTSSVIFLFSPCRIVEIITPGYSGGASD